MKLEERTVEADATQQFSDLLDLCFSVPTGSHFLEDFPVWDPQFRIPWVMRLGSFQQNELVSGAAARLAEIKLLAGKAVTIALIGAVATQPSWRGRGLATGVVLSLIQWAKEN